MADRQTATTTTAALARPRARSRQIGVPVTDEDYRELERNAWSSGQKVADWARDQVVESHGACRREPADRLMSYCVGRSADAFDGLLFATAEGQQ